MHDLDQIRLETEPESDFYENELDALETADGLGETSDPESEEIDATELLAVTSDAELDQFLGKLINRGRKFLNNKAGGALKNLLRSSVKKLLPVAGGAIGTFFGGPAGTALGSTLASKAGQMLGLEVEGLSEQEQDFEVAKGVVRFANAAARNLATASPQALARDPVAAARRAVASAAQTFAPGLLQAVASAARDAVPSGASGRWLRHGNRIILFGA